jgi:hypothetical protein
MEKKLCGLQNLLTDGRPTEIIFSSKIIFLSIKSSNSSIESKKNQTTSNMLKLNDKFNKLKTCNKKKYIMQYFLEFCNILQYFAVFCNILQYFCEILQYFAVFRRIL